MIRSVVETPIAVSTLVRDRAKQHLRVILQRMTRGRMLWRGPAHLRRVALTFDDGPHLLTPRYLDVLGRAGVPATFFLTGLFAENQPAMVAEYLRGGHQLASHGFHHTRFTRLRPDQLRDELSRTARALGPLPQGRWVRPPHGSFGPVDVTTLLVSGYTVGMWSLDSRDYDGSTPAVIAARCAPAHVQPGEVILFHEGQEDTLAALPVVIDELRGAGYELVTMADLFAR